MVAVFNSNNVSIERDTRGALDLAGACCTLPMVGADMRAVAVVQHLHTMIDPVGSDNVALAIKRHIAVDSSELPVATALVADSADAKMLRLGLEPGQISTTLKQRTTFFAKQESCIVPSVLCEGCESYR